MLSTILAIVGALFCFNAIVTANGMRKDEPWIVSLLAAWTFGSSVGVVVSAVDGNVAHAAQFLALSIAAMVMQYVWLITHGYNATEFFLRHHRDDHNK